MRKKVLFVLLLGLLLIPLIDVEAKTAMVDCGNITNIPKKFPQLTSMFVSIIQIAVPVVLVIFGMLDLFKGITAQKEEEIKKGQQMLIKRLITAAIVFFVIVIVRFLISIVADSDTEVGNITECMDCFLSNKCENTPTTISGKIKKIVNKAKK